MGNRAVITTAPFNKANVGIYVHWNGGRPSIEGFLKACKELNFRAPGEDKSYAMARLTQAITCFFGSEGLSVGVDRCDKLDCDNGDNGTYLIGDDWSVAGRKFAVGEHDEVNLVSTDGIAAVIVKRIRALDDF